VSYFGVVEQSPTGGHEREPELVQVPAAAVKEQRESKGKSVVKISRIVDKVLGISRIYVLGR
jgi:hypothetical protein